MTAAQPLLSVVVVSRHDDHGGNLMRRMQFFVSGWLEQAKKHNISSELIIVEWNPLPDRPGLVQALKWPEDTGPCRVRIITVPPEVHQRFKYADKLPVFQMIGKNVGIRRARGRFILATNVDILFSNELSSFLGAGKLDPKYMYRIDRHDIPADIPDNLTLDEQLEFGKRNIIRVYTRKGVIITGESPRKPAKEMASEFTVSVNSGYDTFSKRLSGMHGFKDFTALMKDIFTNAGRFSAEGLVRIFERPVHNNACGDFTLMAPDKWAATHGYAELEMYSMHLDGLLCNVARQAGAKEKILKDPMRIYHIEHAAGSGYQPGAGEKLMDDRLKSAGIPKLSWEQYLAWTKEMKKNHRPMIFNKNDNWGLSDVTLPEIVISSNSRTKNASGDGV
jgi:hypothetical protein